MATSGFSVKFFVYSTYCIILVYLLTKFNRSTEPIKIQPVHDKEISRFSFVRKTFYSHIAVVVESRSDQHLISVIHNVQNNIPWSWPIQVFHSEENRGFLENSTLSRYIETGKVFLTLLEKSYQREETKFILTDPKFWDRVQGEKVLFFQIDAAMCSNPQHRLSDFDQYDYVGAPWDLSFFTFDIRYRVGNGGFSLRSRSKTLALLALKPFDKSTPEDVWYAANFHLVNASVPSIEIAMKFSVESMFYERPIGIHRFPWHCKFREDLKRTCPESVLAMPDLCK